MKKQKSKPSNCRTCYGFGLWGMGDSSPMGIMDAHGGMPTIECPECGANRNPIKASSEKTSNEPTKIRKIKV